MTYLVLHGRRSPQVLTDRLVVPAQDVQSFATALECAQSLTQLLVDEKQRIEAATGSARVAGHAEGLRVGQAEARVSFADGVARMAQDRKVQQEAARASVCTLALAVVKKLSLSLGAHEVVPALMEQAVATLMPEHSVRICVHPELADAVRDRLAQMEFTADVFADESLGAFDCVLEDGKGRSLVGLDSQLATIGKALNVAPNALETV